VPDHARRRGLDLAGSLDGRRDGPIACVQFRPVDSIRPDSASRHRSKRYTTVSQQLPSITGVCPRVHERPLHASRTTGHCQLSESSRVTAAGQHDWRRPSTGRWCKDAAPGFDGSIERPGKSNSTDHGTGEHDHRAAGVPGQGSHHTADRMCRPSSASPPWISSMWNTAEANHASAGVNNTTIRTQTSAFAPTRSSSSASRSTATAIRPGQRLWRAMPARILERRHAKHGPQRHSINGKVHRVSRTDARSLHRAGDLRSVRSNVTTRRWPTHESAPVCAGHELHIGNDAQSVLRWD